MSKKIDKSRLWYTLAREATIKLAEEEREFQVVTVFACIQWTIGFVGKPAKETMAYAQAAVDDLVEEREIEIVPEYYGRPKGYVFRRTGVLDRIVGAIEQDD